MPASKIKLGFPPAVKGQLTKALTCKIPNVIDARERKYAEDQHYRTVKSRVIGILSKLMPREQAKHAARRILATA